MGTKVCLHDMQVFVLYRLNKQRFPTLRLYYTPAPPEGGILYFIPPLHRRGVCCFFYTTAPPGGGVYCFTSVRLSFRPSILSSVQDIFRRIFLSNCWWQKSDIWSQASYRYTILWVAFLDSSDSYFLFADLVGFYTLLTYMHIFRRIFLSNYWWQESDIWSQASYRYAILWEAFLDPSDSYFLFADLVGFLYTLNIYAGVS